MKWYLNVDWRDWSFGIFLLWFSYYHGVGFDIGPIHFCLSFYKGKA
ncbi:hypothetical protein LCGC14_1066500 [marine sediment metagenome]|uniref:Uncharacterized protein n=1 Tax=marine sediment metagenome TaxID=412755 RepID=A0A0F9Q2K0_9ZZZZ